MGACGDSEGQGSVVATFTMSGEQTEIDGACEFIARDGFDGFASDFEDGFAVEIDWNTTEVTQAGTYEVRASLGVFGSVLHPDPADADESVLAAARGAMTLTTYDSPAGIAEGTFDITVAGESDTDPPLVTVSGQFDCIR